MIKSKQFEKSEQVIICCFKRYNDLTCRYLPPSALQRRMEVAENTRKTQARDKACTRICVMMKTMHESSVSSASQHHEGNICAQRQLLIRPCRPFIPTPSTPPLGTPATHTCQRADIPAPPPPSVPSPGKHIRHTGRWGRGCSGPLPSSLPNRPGSPTPLPHHQTPLSLSLASAGRLITAPPSLHTPLLSSKHAPSPITQLPSADISP